MIKFCQIFAALNIAIASTLECKQYHSFANTPYYNVANLGVGYYGTTGRLIDDHTFIGTTGDYVYTPLNTDESNYWCGTYRYRGDGGSGS